MYTVLIGQKMGIKLKAFTLSEVLITLGIIGIVAAITIPHLISDYKNRKFSAILKEDYSILQQIARIGKEEHLLPYEETRPDNKNSMEDWFDRNIKNNMKLSRICYWTGTGCWAQHMEYLTGKKNSTAFCGNNTISFILNNGSSMCIEDLYKSWVFLSGSGLTIVLYIDVNGENSPNVYGKDIFVLAVNDDEFVPVGYNLTDSVLKNNCSKNVTGMYCLARVVKQNFKLPINDL
jgi:prepilin-type N-terminal cleavage/methylation domain-containing protein